VVLAGAGGSPTWRSAFGAIQAEAGEVLTVAAAEELELHVVGMPPVQLPRVPQEYDIVVGDGPIEFEKPKQSVGSAKGSDRHAVVDTGIGHRGRGPGDRA